ncbi:MAG: hypothetical protein Q9169_002738 [Polycauliona sp. 2 TL-2023]
MEIGLESSSSARNTTHRTNIESLATELLMEILLQAPDISTLQSLVHGSPVLHGVYRAKRTLILATVLDRYIALYRLDALAAIKAACIERDATGRSNIGVKGFCGGYPHPMPRMSECLSLQQILAFLRLRRVVDFTTEALCNKTFSSYPTYQPSDSPHTLSLYEDARISRALYRYQTFCILADPNPQPLLDACPDILETPQPHGLDPPNEHSRNTDASQFFNDLPAFEMEALTCIHDFLINYYRDLFQLYESPLDLPKRPHVIVLAKSCLRDGLYFFQQIYSSSPSAQIELLAQHLTCSAHLNMGLGPHLFRQYPKAEYSDDLIPLAKRYQDYVRNG